MTIGELRAAVAEIPSELDEMEVWLQRDLEGNGFESLQGIDADCWIDPRDETVYSTEDTEAEAAADGEEPEEWRSHLRRIAVVFP